MEKDLEQIQVWEDDAPPKLNKGMFSSAKDHWETPKTLFALLDQHCVFTLDVAATKENALCQKYYTVDHDGLKQPWTGNVWCNPPYGRAIGLWVEKAILEARAKHYDVCALLLPFRPDTKWFKKIWDFSHDTHTSVVCTALHGRLKFTLQGQVIGTAPFPSCVITIWPKQLPPHPEWPFEFFLGKLS